MYLLYEVFKEITYKSIACKNDSFKERIIRYFQNTIGRFLAALLSKAMAVSLPIILILIDYYKGRKFTLNVIFEKILFFILSIIFGIVAIAAQKSSNGILEISDYSFFQRIVFASYGFISYLFKLILPLQLSAYYPYPVNSGENLPIYYYLYFILLIIILFSVVYSRQFSRKIIFGAGFFTATVFLVLQFLSSVLASIFWGMDCVTFSIQRTHEPVTAS